MVARDLYALTQVPSPLIQPGRYRFGKHETVVIGEEGDIAQVTWEAPDSTRMAGRSVQDAPVPDTRVDPLVFRESRPVGGVGWARRRRRKIAIAAVIVILVLSTAWSCSMFMGAVHDVAGDMGESYEDSSFHEYDYLDAFDSSAYDFSTFDEIYGDEADANDADGSDAYDDVHMTSESVYEALEGFEAGLSNMDW